MVRKAYGGGYLAMSGSPMQPDCCLALPSAWPALMGPEAAVNAIYYNRIMETPEAERKERKQALHQPHFGSPIIPMGGEG